MDSELLRLAEVAGLSGFDECAPEEQEFVIQHLREETTKRGAIHLFETAVRTKDYGFVYVVSILTKDSHWALAEGDSRFLTWVDAFLQAFDTEYGQ